MRRSEWLNFANRTIDMLTACGLEDYVDYIHSDNVQNQLNKPEQQRHYGQLASLYDILIQTLAAKNPQDSLLFHVLMQQLVQLTHTQLQDNKPKDDSFHKNKLRKLLEILELHSLGKLKKADYPMANNGAIDVKSLSFQLHGTSRHVFHQDASMIDAMAQQLPCFSLAFNGPTVANESANSQAFSTRRTTKAVTAVTQWFANHCPSSIKSVHVDGFSRGGYAAAKSVAALGPLTQQHAWRLYSFQTDPVSATTNFNDVAQAHQVPEHAKVIQIRSSGETRSFMSPFGGEKLQQGCQHQDYSPFRTAPTGAMQTIVLPDKHSIANTYRASTQDKDTATVTATNRCSDLAWSYMHEQYIEDGIFSATEDTVLDVPVRHKTPSRYNVTKTAVTFFAKKDQRQTQRLLDYSKLYTEHEHGHFEFDKLQSIQAEKDNLAIAGSKEPIKRDRYEKRCLGRYGVGVIRFLNAEHFEVFAEKFPHLANRLNPENSLIQATDTDIEAVRHELDQLEQLINRPGNDNRFLRDIVQHMDQQLAPATQLTAEQQGLAQLKAELSRACQIYIHTNWRTRGSWFSLHRGAGINRALALDHAIQTAENKVTLLTLIQDHLAVGAAGNWHKNSLKTHLYVMARRLHQESPELIPMKYIKNYRSSFNSELLKQRQPRNAAGVSAAVALSPLWVSTTPKCPCPDRMRPYYAKVNQPSRRRVASMTPATPRLTT